MVGNCEGQSPKSPGHECRYRLWRWGCFGKPWLGQRGVCEPAGLAQFQTELGLKTTSAAFGVSNTDMRCMLGGLGLDALGPTPSTMPDVGLGRLVADLSSARAAIWWPEVDGWAGQGPWAGVAEEVTAEESWSSRKEFLGGLLITLWAIKETTHMKR